VIDQKRAIAYGGALDEDPHDPATLPEALARAAQQDEVKGLMYLQQDGSAHFHSYATLCAEAEHILAGLRALALRPGAMVMLQVEENQHYLPTFWACVLGGLVVVPISIAPSYEQPGIVTTKLQRAWELCERPLIVASSRLAPALRSLVGVLGMESAQIETVEALRAYPSTPDVHHWHACRPDDLFLILFTSGSTGIPKGVTLTHRNVLSLVRGYTHLEGLTNQEVTFNWMPLDHVGGLVTFHLRDVYLGCQQFHASPQTVLQDPLTWLDCLDRFHATCTWAPNFAFSLINEYLSASPATRKTWDLSALHYILDAGEAIVPKTARRFLELLRPYGLPTTAIHPSWGMSETSSGVTFSSRFALETTTDEDRFVDVGTLIPNVEVRAVDMHDQLLVEGQSGRIQVKGPTVTPGYYRNPALNTEVFTTDGWFDTGDVGSLRDGRLTITGRTKNIIIINGLNYYCHEIEAVVEEIPGVEVTYTGACAVRAATDNTDALAIFYCTQLTDEQAVLEQCQEIRRRVVSTVGINPTYLLPVAQEAIPKTETGKIQRNKLKQQFADGMFDVLRARMDLLLSTASKGDEASVAQNEIEQQLILIWQRALGIDLLDIHDNFFDLGGDSLVNVRMVALACSAGLHMTQNHIIEHQTIAELAVVLKETASN
jgi:acyl-CoA synthetase (AMP-forming)/AMP-acid ligase II